MKCMLVASVIIGMLTGPAYSQVSLGGGGQKTPLQLKYDKEDQERKDSERAYDEQMKRLKSQAPAAAKRDPWAGVRPAPEPNSKR
jgi:hypothetical protein